MIILVITGGKASVITFRSDLLKLLNKTLMKYTLIALATTFLFACNTDTRKNENVLLRKGKAMTVIKLDPAQAVDFFNLSEVSDSTFVIPLETRDECLLDGISAVKIADGKIFVSGGENTLSPVYVFDSKGRFLNKIGTRGKGPGEIIEPQGFVIDSEKEEVNIYENVLRKHLFFDYNGVFLREVKNDIYCTDFARVTDEVNAYFSCFQVNRPEHDGYNYQLIVASPSGKRVGVAFPYSKEMYDEGCRVQSTNFSTFKDSLYFLDIFNDTIYAVTESEISPRFIFDFGKHAVPEDIWTDRYTTEQRSKLWDNPNLIPGPHSFIRIKDYVHFKFIYNNYGHTGFYNLTNGRLIFSTRINDDLSGLMLHHIVGHDNTYLYYAVEHHNLKMYQDYLLKEGKTPSKQLLSIVENYDKSSNPFLLCVRIKDALR